MGSITQGRAKEGTHGTALILVDCVPVQGALAWATGNRSMGAPSIGRLEGKYGMDRSALSVLTYSTYHMYQGSYSCM